MLKGLKTFFAGLLQDAVKSIFAAGLGAAIIGQAALTITDQIMTSTEGDATIIARWGGEKALSASLGRLVADLCPLICGSDAPLPVLQLKPSWFASGVMGGGHAGADYEPLDGDRPATIGIFPSVLKDEAKVRSVLTHELIHHWEHLGSVGAESLAYPDECDALISARYPDESMQRRWRSGHSRVFISKAAEVARDSNIRVEDLLFEQKRT